MLKHRVSVPRVPTYSIKVELYSATRRWQKKKMRTLITAFITNAVSVIATYNDTFETACFLSTHFY